LFAGADGDVADAYYGAGGIGGVDFDCTVKALGGYCSRGADGGDGGIAAAPRDGFIGGVSRKYCSFQRFGAFERECPCRRIYDDTFDGDVILGSTLTELNNNLLKF